MALSMSGPLSRMSDEVVSRAVPVLRKAAAEIGAELNRNAPVDDTSGA
jgi:DNA-binding IclR family transcriptional regulator